MLTIPKLFQDFQKNLVLLMLNKRIMFHLNVWFCTGFPLNLQILLLVVVVLKLEHISCLHRLPCMKYMNKSTS